MPKVAVQAFEIEVGTGRKRRLSQLPSLCPRCRTNAVPATLGVGRFGFGGDEPDEFGPDLEVPVRCPACGKCYVVLYASNRYLHEDETWSETLTCYAVVPNTLRHTEVAERVHDMSPNFAAVFDEAEAARIAGLTELAGGGYRRALEFLVKDYLILRYPDREEMFIRTALRSCIKDHLDDPTVRTLAENAASIGNEFVHYRMYEQRDIRELRTLIRLVWRLLELRLETDAVLGRIAQGSADF